ncbi:MAG: hypothetical protein N2690_04035 [Rhodocyclaceae bacterium]|nr:hypothetical protein [Rhodocyclaceae bacterium]
MNLRHLTNEERLAVCRRTVQNQHAAAVCVERLLAAGETVVGLRVLPAGKPVVAILPPAGKSRLWRDGAAFRLTPAEAEYVAIVAGCEVRWTVSRAEAELRRIACGGRMH